MIKDENISLGQFRVLKQIQDLNERQFYLLLRRNQENVIENQAILIVQTLYPKQVLSGDCLDQLAVE